MFMKKAIALILVLIGLMSCAGEYGYDMTTAYDDRLTVVAMLGDQSDFVLVVETALYEKGYLDEVCVDGYFDEYTELAVMDFQYYKGYQEDGMLTKGQFYWLHRKYYNQWFDTSDIVYITNSGSRYHSYDCKSLQYSYGIMPVSTNIALELGYLPCKVCNPTPYLYY